MGKPRLRVAIASLLAAATATVGLGTAAPLGAQEQPRGECRYVVGEFSDAIELIDLATSSKRIVLRKNGKWVRTVDGATTRSPVSGSQRGGDWIARVVPKSGDRYDLPCEVSQMPSNRTLCNITFGEDAQLRFPGIDARRIIVRVDGSWQATLPGDADRWTDPTPDPDGQYFIRVREKNGDTNDVVCKVPTNREFTGTGEIVNGAFLPFGFVPGPKAREINLEAATGITEQVSTVISGDGSAILATELSRDSERRTFRVDLATSAVDVVGEYQFGDQIDFAGDTVVYTRNGNIRVRQYDGADVVSDRWVIRDRNLRVITISGSGEFAVIVRDSADGFELVRLNLATKETKTLYATSADRLFFDVSFDADRVLVKSTDDVVLIDAATGEQTEYKPESQLFKPGFGVSSSLSGDGSTLALSQLGCFVECPLEVIDIDTGDRRLLVGRELSLVQLNQDGSRILITEDEGEDIAVLDLNTRDLVGGGWLNLLLSNGRSIDAEFTIATTEENGFGVISPRFAE